MPEIEWSPMTSRTYQHLSAKNDPNGNAQRLYVVYELVQMIDDEYGYQPPEWRMVEVYDEGNTGLPAELRGIAQLPGVGISRSEYHAIYRMAQAGGLLRYGS